nr:hypothetical protein [Moritella viscosa]SHO15568.1 Sigma 54 interacting domain protein [Moritella viscosa]
MEKGTTTTNKVSRIKQLLLQAIFPTSKIPKTKTRKVLSILFPQASQMKRIAHKLKTNEKIKYNKYFVSLFSILTISLFCQTSAAADAIQILINDAIKNPDTVFANILAMINPDATYSTELNATYASKDIGIYYALISEFIRNAFLSLSTVTFLWFTAKVAIDKTMGVTNSATITKAMLFGVLILTSLPELEIGGMKIPTFTIPTVVHGKTIHKPVLQYIFDRAIYDTVAKADEMATTNLNKNISIPSYKVVSPKHLSSDFTKFDNVYLLGYSKSDKTTDTLSIEYKDDQYRVEFEMGGSTTKITTKSSSALNGLATQLGIDLFSLEQAFFKSYVEHMMNNATRLGSKLASIDFSYLEEDKQTGDFQDFQNVRGSRLTFIDDYTTYCENIYEYPLAGSDKKAIQRYLKTAELCAAKAFLEEHYKSPYDTDENSAVAVYNGKSLLRNNNLMMFAKTDLVLTYNEVLERTKNVCSNGGYLACAEVVQFTSLHNMEANKYLGVLSIPVSIINELTGSFYDISDKILSVKMFEQDTSRTIQFTDIVQDDKALYNLQLTLHHTNNTGLIADAFDLYDFSRMRIPAIEDVVGTVIGGDPTLPYERVNKCFNYTNEIAGGFNCNSATKELLDFGVGQIKTGVAILAANSVVSAVPTKSKLKDGVVMGKSKGAKLTSGVGAVVAMVIPSLFTNPTKDDPYYSQNTVQGMVFLSYLVSFYNADFTNALNTFAKMEISIGSAIVVLIYGFYFHIFLLFITTLLELIIDSKVLLLKLYTAIIDGGIDGLGSVFKEAFSELCFLGFLVVMMNKMPDILEVLLLNQFESIFTILGKMQGSVENVLISTPELLLSLVVKIIVLMLVAQFLTGLLQRILQQTKPS